MTKFIFGRSMAVTAFCATIVAGSGLSPAPAKAYSWDGHDRRIVVMNRSQQPIVDLRTSSVRNPLWGPDRLREDILAPGESGVLNADDGDGYCRYDFRYEFFGGTVLVRSDVNVCDEIGVVLR
jgi:hypothetical protein